MLYVALQASNADVYKAAADLLIGVHVKLSPALLVDKRSVWERFVTSCMEHVQSALADLRAPELSAEARKICERRVEVCCSRICLLSPPQPSCRSACSVTIYALLCMALLALMLQSEKLYVIWCGVQAALGLLQKFLGTVEDSGRKSKEHYTVPWTVTFTYSDGDVVKQILLPENPTVGQLRTEAGAKIKFAPDRVRCAPCAHSCLRTHA